MRRYAYVGPEAIRRQVAGAEQGTEIRAAADLVPMLRGEPMTFVVDERGALRVADRRSEHVACAGGGVVFSAGELVAVRDGGVELQGDLRDRVRAYLTKQGHGVKG